MAILECSECKHIVSSKASTCPNCGAPVKLSKNNIKDELTEKEIIKEKRTVLNNALYIIFFIILIIITVSDATLITTFRNTYSLIAAESEPTFEQTANLYSNIIINSTFISCLLSIYSKKTFKLSKLTFYINLITHCFFFQYIYELDFRIGLQFYILYIINIIFLLLPRYNKLDKINKIINKKDIDKIDDDNFELELYYKQKTYTKEFITQIFASIAIALIILGYITYLNKDEIVHETVIQEKTDYQIQITNEYINVRTQPSTNSDKIGEVNNGDIYNVLDVIGGDNYVWYKITYENKIGYISSNKKSPYLKELYKDKLIVYLFCNSEDKCNTLKENLYEYKKENDIFLIKYINIEDKSNKDIFNKVLEYYGEKEEIPYVVIGTERILYSKNIMSEIKSTIKNPPKDNINVVDKIKKAEELPALKKPNKEQ